MATFQPAPRRLLPRTRSCTGTGCAARLQRCASRFCCIQDPAVQQSQIRKGQESGVAKIVFKNVGIHLDVRTLTFSKDRTTATVFTSRKRVSVRLCPGTFQQDILSNGKWRECNLVYKKGRKGTKGSWQLHIAVERDLKLPSLRNLKRRKFSELMSVKTTWQPLRTAVCSKPAN